MAKSAAKVAPAAKPQVKILIRQSAIQKRIAEIGKHIAKDYAGERVHRP